VSTSAREGDGYFSCGKLPVGLGARRGGLPWRRWAVRLAAGRGSARGAKGSGAFKLTSDPPSDQGMDGGALGRAHAGDSARTTGPWRVVPLARFSKRSRGSRHREADIGLGKARPASGTCAGGVGSRGGVGPKLCRCAPV
jgi:hypothetical protein